MRLDGEIALVTGPTAGIGRAIAVEFAAEGARVVVTGRDAERGEATVSAARKASGDTGGEATFVTAELADEAACTALVDATVAVFGALTVLVNMNFDHMPELRWFYGYPLVVAAMFAVCSLMYWRFRRSGWL